MQEVIVVGDPREPLGRPYGEPLAGLRVSWGAALAGAFVMLAVSVVLWALALGLIALVARPEAASLKGSLIALWVCAMAATLVGAFVGGIVAGYLPGSPRRAIGMAHGFLAWAVALVISLGFQLVVLRGLVDTTTGLVVDAVTAESTAAAESALPAPPSLRNTAPGQYPTMQPGRRGPNPDQAAYAARVALDYVTGAGWSWFGTWFLAGLLAIAGALLGVGRLDRMDRDERRVEPDRPIDQSPIPTP